MEEQKSIKRRAYIWNTVSGMISAGQSAIILIFIAHFQTQTYAGLFTIAYALANLFSTMGRYGVRTYQVTDVQEKSTFGDYLLARQYTVIGALSVMAIYLFVEGFMGTYSLSKIGVVTATCLWKMIDVVEDVYYGMYQQKGRLDIAAKYYSLRALASTAVFCILLIFKVSLLVVSVVVTVFSAILAVIMIRATISPFGVSCKLGKRQSALQVIRLCFPLFLGTTLSMFVGNSPKYMIDWYMDEKSQAIFGFIMMPAFVIMVLNQFIYQPIILELGELWQSGERTRFIRRVLKQYLVVLGVTLVVMLGGNFLGIPVLSLLYNVNLAPYKVEFMLLLLGGGAYALVSFIMVPITAMRFQRCIPFGFAGTSVLSVVLSKIIVPTHGIMGAAWLYLILNLVLAMYLTICFLYRGQHAIPRTK